MARGTDSAVAAADGRNGRGMPETWWRAGGRWCGLVAQFLALRDGCGHAGPTALPAQHPADAGERKLIPAPPTGPHLTNQASPHPAEPRRRLTAPPPPPPPPPPTHFAHPPPRRPPPPPHPAAPQATARPPRRPPPPARPERAAAPHPSRTAPRAPRRPPPRHPDRAAPAHVSHRSRHHFPARPRCPERSPLGHGLHTAVPVGVTHGRHPVELDSEPLPVRPQHLLVRLQLPFLPRPVGRRPLEGTTAERDPSAVLRHPRTHQ